MGKYTIPFSLKLETTDDKEWAKKHIGDIRAFIKLRNKVSEIAPTKEPDFYHAEVSEAGDMVKCPIGKNKGLWVRESVCRKCQETKCDIKR